jgi:hypothetical protein
MGEMSSRRARQRGSANHTGRCRASRARRRGRTQTTCTVEGGSRSATLPRNPLVAPADELGWMLARADRVFEFELKNEIPC